MKKGKDLIVDWESFIQNGDQSSFYDLYSHYHDYLTYLGLKKGANPEKTKDCVNDLFLYIYENRQKLGHILNHHNYLVTCFLRKLLRKQHFSAEESLDLLNFEDTLVHPSVEALHIQQHANASVTSLLKSYINRLSESQTRLIYQKFYLGLSYDEISESNQITVKTAYNTIYNAVERLKKIIGEEGVGPLSILLSLLSLLILFYLKNS
ncbi:RNA polymerase sigma factor [Pedobacter hiemivivus]|uniref:Sigma-70 family RNA polymerase sigma factor n=1 Tax=Pedobacter hiemivivus TaxID=2530454 RepID=A0A4R0N8J2_9SPHI|nr:sigma-70 family RNA polymerase sigma factor [Pedobacter hiemivivus]TCC96479.1 sigma-70 family RNA polymerase sigma factor [Pedobacter hiemivivus]